MLMGCLMAGIMARFIPNLNVQWALLGGIAGGFLGVIAFIIIASTMGVGYRQGGAFFLGACIGFMVGVVEQACRSAWLTVVYSPRRFSQVNMGATPVTIGSGPGDTVRVDGCPSSAISFKIQNGTIQCTENGVTQNIKPGEERMVGKVKLVVCTPKCPYTGGQRIGGGSGSNPFQPQQPRSGNPFPQNPPQSNNSFPPPPPSNNTFPPPPPQAAQPRPQSPPPSPPGGPQGTTGSNGSSGPKRIKLPPRD